MFLLVYNLGFFIGYFGFLVFVLEVGRRVRWWGGKSILLKFGLVVEGFNVLVVLRVFEFFFYLYDGVSKVVLVNFYVVGRLSEDVWESIWKGIMG